eukprot:1282530-Prymnesium_polylepis.1
MDISAAPLLHHRPRPVPRRHRIRERPRLAALHARHLEPLVADRPARDDGDRDCQERCPPLPRHVSAPAHIPAAPLARTRTRTRTLTSPQSNPNPDPNPP